MGTKEEKLKRYKNLWLIFEETLDKEDLNLSSFSKKWERHHNDEDSDYKKFYHRIKKQKYQLKALKNAPQDNTVLQIEEYIKFLNEDFTAEEIRYDETYEHWFN